MPAPGPSIGEIKGIAEIMPSISNPKGLFANEERASAIIFPNPLPSTTPTIALTNTIKGRIVFITIFTDSLPESTKVETILPIPVENFINILVFT